jgi:hypothetical protein
MKDVVERDAKELGKILLNPLKIIQISKMFFSLWILLISLSIIL